MHMAARSSQMSQWAISHKTLIHQKSTFILAGAPGATCLLAVPYLNYPRLIPSAFFLRKLPASAGIRPDSQQEPCRDGLSALWKPQEVAASLLQPEHGESERPQNGDPQKLADVPRPRPWQGLGTWQGFAVQFSTLSPKSSLQNPSYKPLLFHKIRS